MSWTVQISGPARRDLKRLDQQNRSRIMEGIDRLAESCHGDVVRLKSIDPPQWRLRIGEWRVLFVYRPKESEISVVRVLPRGKAYDRR